MDVSLHTIAGSYRPIALTLTLFGVLLSGAASWGQSVSGIVTDATSGQPLPGAIVRVKDESGKTLKYKMTDQQGRFRIEADKDNAKEMVFSLLGYQEQTLSAPFESSYEIALEEKKEKIQHAVVEAKKVQMAGDTTIYNVKALTKREDLVLGDVLKRIPGIEITSTGHLKVDGRDLGRFYINGKDVLEGNYNLATKKLPVDAVKKIEVMRNHQYIKMLQDMRQGDAAAVNIVLNDNAMGKVNALGAAGGGVQAAAPYIPHSESLTAFYIGDGVSSVNDAGFDATGNAAKDLAPFRLPSETARYQIDSKISIASTKAPLSDSRSLFNKTFDTRSINTLSTGESSKVGVTVAYSWDERNSSDSKTSIYNLESGERTIRREEERLSRRSEVSGKLSWSNNSSRNYVSETILADFGWERGLAEVTGDDSRSQMGKRRHWDLDNNLQTLLKVGKRRVVGVSNYTQISGFRENLEIPESGPCQHIGSSAFFDDLSLSSIKRTRGMVTYSLKPRLQWTLFRRDSRLEGIGDEVKGIMADDTKATYLSGGLTWNLSFKKGAFSTEAGGALHYDRASFGSYSSGRPLSDETLSLKYETGRFLASAEGGIATTKPSVQDLGAVLILYDYDALRRGQESLVFLPRRHIGAEIIFREPVRGWYTRISSTLTGTKSLLGGRDVLENYILSYNTDETVALSSWATSAEITKGLYSINGKVSAKMTSLRSASTFRQNSLATEYVTGLLSPSLEVMTSPLSFWNIDARLSVGFSTMTASGKRTATTRNTSASITNSFYLSKKMTAGVVTDLFRNSTIGKTIIFPDAFITWKSSRNLRLRLKASNLLNRKEYSYMILSPLMQTSYSYRIRPLSVMLHADMTL